MSERVVEQPMRQTDLISPSYCDEQKRLHAEPRGYGQRGYKWADTVVRIAAEARCESILDYGCGQGSLRTRLMLEPLAVMVVGDTVEVVQVREYDPAIEGKDALPEPADLVVCTDVMEHVEADKILSVLRHLSILAIKRLFLVVSLVETGKLLSDGRQAHISLPGLDWWKRYVGLYFEVLDELPIKPEKQWVCIARSKYPRAS